MDFPLFPADTGIPLVFIVKTNNFTSEKVRLTSGKLQKMPFLGIQSYHLRSAKIVPFLRNLDFCTPNLVSDGSFGFLSKGDNYFWEKIPKTDHSSNVRIIFSCLVLGKSSKIALFHTVFWIARYCADLGPFFTQNRKVRSKMNQKKCGPHMVNDIFFSLWEYWSWVSARAQTMHPLGEKTIIAPRCFKKV